MNKIIAVIIVVFAISSVYAQDFNRQSSLFFKSEQTMRDRELRGSQGSGEGGSDDFTRVNGLPRVSAGSVSWTVVEETEVKGVSVHDLVTITIREKSSHGSESDNKSEKEASLSMVLSDWLDLSGGHLKPAAQSSGDPKIAASMSRGIDGESEITREDYLTAEIQAEVVDVYPNGNVLLEASHFIRTDDETTLITLTGVCRSNDIDSNNTIMSTRIANLKINKEHSGIATDYIRRGWLVKLVDFINPF